MGIYNVTVNPSANGQTSSGWAGNAVWLSSETNVHVYIAPGQGSSWCVWQVQIAGATPGEVFNGIRIQGTADFTVGGGGGGITRTAEQYVDLEKVFTSFIDKVGTSTGIVIPGSGVGQEINYVKTAPGFTSDDLIAGTFYVGLGALSTAADAGLGDGNFRTATLTWTIYTGADLPDPPPGTPTGYLTNPASNTNPGVSEDDGVFLPVTFVLTGGTGAFKNVVWTLPTAFPNPAESKIKFDINGTQSYSVPLSGSQVDTGTMSVVPAWATPGQYTLSCNVTGFDGGGTIGLSAVLTIKEPGGSGWFWEF